MQQILLYGRGAILGKETGRLLPRVQWAQSAK
jgi:hypothetical protein